MTTTRSSAALVTLALSVATLLAACGTSAQAEELRSDAEHQPLRLDQAPAADAVATATEDLGLVLLQSAAATDATAGINTVVSPASLLMALSMLAEGARGDTADAFDDALGASGSERSDAVNALSQALRAYDGDPAIVQDLRGPDDVPDEPLLHLANQLVIDDGFEVHPQYLDTLARSYDAGVQVTDLSTDEGIEVLSAWADEHTGGLIPESAIQPRDDLVLVWQNAVVMVARWQQPFMPHDTVERDFTLADRTTVSADLLRGGLFVTLAEADGWQAVRLPYTEGFAAEVILPPQGTDPASIDGETMIALLGALDAASPQDVIVSMPTLDISTEPLDLTPALENLGLGGLFEGPDLSGISNADLEVDQAFQQATLQVHEGGTIAAALTEIGVAESAAPIVDLEFTADRPYLLRIAHSETRLPIFVAAVRDPRHD